MRLGGSYQSSQGPGKVFSKTGLTIADLKDSGKEPDTRELLTTVVM